MDTARPGRWTYEDYRNLPDDGKRYEIIDGDLLVSPGPSNKHQRACFVLGCLLEIHVAEHTLGWGYGSSTDVVLSPNSVVQPDVSFVSTERKHILTSAGICGAPDFVAEVLSPATAGRDRTAKLRLYASHGVREYWIVDPEAQAGDVFVLEGDDLARKARVTAGVVESLAALPGFRVPLDRLFDRDRPLDP
jgi:Uma2 family endonuclease